MGREADWRSSSSAGGYLQTEALGTAHPAGEEDFEFTTAGGKVALRVTAEALTPSGGLVPWAAFLRKAGVIERLAASCPVTRTSPNAAPIADVLHGFALTVVCAGMRFAHVQRLREDPSLAELFGLKRVVSDDTLGGSSRASRSWPGPSV